MDGRTLDRLHAAQRETTMKAKALEIRDRATFLPVLAVDMNPGLRYPLNAMMSESELAASLDAYIGRTYLLLRCGYPCDEKPNIILTRLIGSGEATNDPYEWGDRTFFRAHLYIIEHWAELKDGDVIDVEFILGETSKPKVSERVS
jgi:hypothetical protein